MADKKKKCKHDEKVKEYASFLYMLPEKLAAGGLAEALDFIQKEAVEVWTEVNFLELTLQNGTLTFEDMQEELGSAADEALLKQLEVKQVYACDYETTDSKEVQKIMTCLLERAGGFLASDTEDFKPFLRVAEL